MSRELTYELFEEQTRRLRVLVAMCAVAIVLVALGAFAPAVLKYYFSSADVPSNQTVVTDSKPVSAIATNESANQNVRVINIDRSAETSSMTTERREGETTGEIAFATPEVARAVVEDQAAPAQAAKGWAPLQPAAQATVSDGEVTTVLRPPFPRSRPRVEAIIARSQIPLPLPRPQIQFDEPTAEPDVTTDRLSVLN